MKVKREDLAELGFGGQLRHSPEERKREGIKTKMEESRHGQRGAGQDAGKTSLNRVCLMQTSFSFYFNGFARQADSYIFNFPNLL